MDIEEYTESLLNEGFDLDTLIRGTQIETHELLREAGIEPIGHIARMMVKMDIDSGLLNIQMTRKWH